jgi:hypothetical protein
MSDQDPAPPADPLARAVLGPHPTIDHLAHSAHPDHAPEDPRDEWEVIDAFMSVTSRHLAAIEDVVLPLARTKLPDGHARVTTYLQNARGLEQNLHLLKARTYGDKQKHYLHMNDLWQSIGEQMHSHEEMESDFVRDLTAVLPAEQMATIADQVIEAGDHAPTRPHPMTPHTGPLGRAAHRLWRVADSFWDTAEGRVIPHRRKPPHPREGSLFTRYMMGAPTFDESEGAERPET